MKKSLLHARNNYFILEHGRDCDGVWTRGCIRGYVIKEEAEWDHRERCEWSDGMSYTLTSSVCDAKDYCEEHELDFEGALEPYKWDVEQCKAADKALEAEAMDRACAAAERFACGGSDY